MDRYQENFQRASCLILKRGTRAKRILLEHHLTENNLTLGMFLQQNKHDIYHCYHTTKCCQCTNGYRNPKRRVLKTTQMELIFEDNGRIQGHTKGIGVNKYCCRDVRGFLCLEDFDITLLNFLLTNFCLNTFLQSCLLVGDTVGKTLEMFLNENKHALFHFWKKTKCCVGGCVFQNTLIFNTCQWNSIYDQLPNSCQNVCCCSYQAKYCIEESSIDKDLLGQILQRTCPLKIASDNIVEARNTAYSHVSDAAISDNEFKRVFDECTANILTIYESCKADVNQEEFEINLIRNMKYSAELRTEYQNMLLQQMVNNNNIEEELFRLNGRIDQIQSKDETVYAVVLQNSHGLDEMNERLARLEKLCTNKELPEPVDHVDCYFDSEDGDLVTCGRCGTHFYILDEFKRHKRLCKNERESKKFKVEVRNMDEQWETSSQTFIRNNRNLVDTEHIKIDNAKSGSLVMIGRITLAVFSSSDVFINSITTLLSKLFRYNPPEMGQHRNFEVDVNVLDTDTADDVDVDIYHCGLCKKDCSGVSSFIDHKESLEHIQKREGKKGYTKTTTTSDHAFIPTEPPSCDSIYKGNQPKKTHPNYTGYDTRSGQQEYDPNSGRPRYDHRTGHAGFDPRTGQPVYDPRTGQYQITPNPGHFPRCKGNNSYKKEPDQASLPMQPPNYESIYKGQSGESPPFYMGHAEYDQRSGQPAYDPNSGQAGYDPRTGQPGFEPSTGQGYDPRTGQPVYDPRTGQYQITLNPGQQQFYPQQWPPYNPNDEKQADWHGHWHGGNPPPPGYGYPGYPYGFQGYQGSPGQGGQQVQFDAASNPSSMPTDLIKEYRTEQKQANVDYVGEPEQEEEPKTYQLKVSKLPPKTTEDSLQFFFENTKKSGGGDVESVDYDEETSTAIITFEEDDAVDRVLQKLPILFLKKAIEVEAIRPVVEPPSGKEEEKCYECDDGSGDPEVTCIIEVRGMKSNTTEDTIMYYFESKRGGKAEVTNIEFVEDKKMFLVTFEDEEAVNRVLDKSHTVDGTKLQVKKHIPPKRCPNKALIKGLSEKTSKDGLVNFLEAKTKKDVENVEFSDEDAKKAIVTFDEPIDIDELQTICKKKSIDGCHLTVQPVVVSNCIIVRGFSDKTTDSALEHYFDNKKRSGVEGVTNVNMVKDEDYCLIHFEESKDALEACQRPQTVDKSKLHVNIFYECLGIPAGEEGSKFKPIPPVAIDNIDPRKMDFLQHSMQSKGDLEKQLKIIHADILWPTDKSDKKILKISCTMTKETNDWRKLAKSWKDDVRKVVDTYVASLVVEKHSTLQEAWATVMDKLRAINIQDPDEVTVKVEKKPACEIFIIGKSAAVSQVSGKIKEIIDEVTQDLEMKKQQIQEEVPMKHYQLLILEFTKFPDKVRKTFDNMEVKIDRKRNIIAFNGITKNVNGAKVMMYETINKISSVPTGKKSNNYIQFFNKPEVKSLVGEKIKAKGIVGVWEVHDNAVIMHSLSDENAVSAADILKDTVIESKVQIDNLSKSLLHSQKWTQHMKSIEDKYKKKSITVQICVSKQDEVTLLCTDKNEGGDIRFFLFEHRK